VIPLGTVILNVQNPISNIREANLDHAVLDNGEPVGLCKQSCYTTNNLSFVTSYRIDRLSIKAI